MQVRVWFIDILRSNIMLAFFQAFKKLRNGNVSMQLSGILKTSIKIPQYLGDLRLVIQGIIFF